MEVIPMSIKPLLVCLNGSPDLTIDRKTCSVIQWRILATSHYQSSARMKKTSFASSRPKKIVSNNNPTRRWCTVHQLCRSSRVYKHNPILWPVSFRTYPVRGAKYVPSDRIHSGPLWRTACSRRPRMRTFSWWSVGLAVDYEPFAAF